ncbi:MAG: tetratricopeptide repeat protein [Calditrichaceae bacterium]|nr:tetratricopeptide repeat protein [Calditrichaceae bacterium]MBN2708612.1 tetratricopeptide repeat protein [Calditrichaceae bacterium]RQV95463.1 MAG: hypothetical protein EH224_07535 [Calditrichota bacterium]
MKPLNTKILCLVLTALLIYPVLSQKMTILVHPFTNNGALEYSWISAGMTASVISDLCTIRDIDVISDMDRKKAIEEIRLGLSGLLDEEKTVMAGKMLGANIIFTGSYQVSGDKIRVNASLINVEKGSTERSVKIDGAIGDIFGLQDEIVFTLMAETEKLQLANIKQVRISDEDKMAIIQSERPELSAYELYSIGLEIKDEDPHQALDYFKQAVQIQPDYAEALYQAGSTAGISLDLFEEGFKYLDRVNKLYSARGETNTSGYAELMKCIGMVYLKKGKFDSALDYYSRARNIMNSLDLGESWRYAFIIMNIGMVYSTKGQHDQALTFYSESRKICEILDLQSTNLYANLLIAIGNGYSEDNQLDKALQYYSKSKEIKDNFKLQNTDSYALLMTNIGIVYQQKKKPDKALEYFLTAKLIKDNLKLNNTLEYAHLMQCIGTVYAMKKQYHEAMGYYNKAFEIFDLLKMQESVMYGNLFFNLAVLYEEQGENKSAGEYFRKAYDTFTKAGYSGKLKENALEKSKRLK